MSTHYIIDGNNPSLLSSEINDVMLAPTGSTVVNGDFVVRVDDGVRIASTPRILSELLTQKYQAILANYPNMNHIVYDAMLDSTGVTVINQPCRLGSRGTNSVSRGFNLQPFGGAPTPGSLRTNAFSTAPTQVSQCIVQVEFHRWVYSNPVNGRVQRTYVEVHPDEISDLSVAVYVDGQYAVTASISGGLTVIPSQYAGTSVQLHFGASLVAPFSDICISSWAFLY